MSPLPTYLHPPHPPTLSLSLLFLFLFSFLLFSSQMVYVAFFLPRTVFSFLLLFLAQYTPIFFISFPSSDFVSSSKCLPSFVLFLWLCPFVLLDFALPLLHRDYLHCFSFPWSVSLVASLPGDVSFSPPLSFSSSGICSPLLLFFAQCLPSYSLETFPFPPNPHRSPSSLLHLLALCLPRFSSS